MVIMSLQMKRAVNQEMRQVVSRATAHFHGFTSHRLQSQNDIASAKPRQRLIGKHISWFVAAPMQPIQALNLTVRCQDHRAAHAGGAHHTRRESLNIRNKAPPFWVVHQYAGLLRAVPGHHTLRNCERPLRIDPKP